MPKLPKILQQLTNVDTAITTLLITNLVSVAGLWLLFKTYCQPNQIDWSKSSEVIKNIAEVIAIFVAGVWTYYLFIRGRLHKERVELVLKGRLVTIAGRVYLITTGKITNVGGSDFQLKENGCVLTISVYSAPEAKGIYTPQADDSSSFLIFPNETCLEPNESTQNERITSIDKDFIAIGIELHVESLKQTWYTSLIVEKPSGDAMNDGKRYGSNDEAKKHYPTIQEESDRRQQQVEDTTRREDQARDKDSK